jgi:hypothetical protein
LAVHAFYDEFPSVRAPHLLFAAAPEFAAAPP